MEARQKSERLTTDRKYTEDRWKLERKRTDIQYDDQINTDR